jgi:hypothetical protein
MMFTIQKIGQVFKYLLRKFWFWRYSYSQIQLKFNSNFNIIQSNIQLMWKYFYYRFKNKKSLIWIFYLESNCKKIKINKEKLFPTFLLLNSNETEKRNTFGSNNITLIQYNINDQEKALRYARISCDLQISNPNTYQKIQLIYSLILFLIMNKVWSSRLD